MSEVKDRRFMMNSGFKAASAHLTDKYLSPVPSQFLWMPRALRRAGSIEISGFSNLGYLRALADDCLAITGCIDHGRTFDDSASF